MRTLLPFRSAAVLLLVLTLTLMIGSVVPISAQASTPSATPTPRFTALRMISATNGWAVVTVPDSSSARTSPIPGMIYPGMLAYVLHTHDGGQSWANASPSLPQEMLDAGTYGCDCADNGFAGFSFLDDSHAWVMVDDAGFRGNQLFYGISLRRTSDTGQSWKDDSSAMDAPSVIASTFIDPKHGWLLAGNLPSIDGSDQPALLYRTSDGVRWDLIADDGVYSHDESGLDHSGEPISPVETGITAMMHKDIAFESTSSGWMLVDNPDSTDAHLLHTTDGGVTWKPNDVLPDVNEDYCGLSLLKLTAPGGVTFMTACLSGQYLYHSSDDGLTWQNHLIPAHVLNLAPSKPIFMLDAATAWSIGCEANASDCTDPTKPSVLYKTKDGGVTWDMLGKLSNTFKVAPNEIYSTVAQFDFISDQIGWAIDPTGALFSTKDAGKTWTAIQPAISLP